MASRWKWRRFSAAQRSISSSSRTLEMMYTSSEETPSHAPVRENSIFEEKPSASTMKLWCTAAGALEVHTAVISAPVARCC
jgi:hypothetical protein